MNDGIAGALAELKDNGLGGSVELLAGFALASLSEHGASQLQIQASVDLADTLLEKKEYARALVLYEEASLARKKTNKGKLKWGENAAPHTIKYRIFQCRIGIGDTRAALAVLGSVPQKSRTLAMEMDLARTYHSMGGAVMAGKAVDCYSTVLESCPMAFEALLGLLKLGVKRTKIDLIIDGRLDGDVFSSWIQAWLAGHELAQNGSYAAAVAQFRSLTTDTMLPGCHHLLLYIAYWEYLQGHFPAAKKAFSRARESDPSSFEKMDIYASVLAESGTTVELNGLCAELVKDGKQRWETWVALATYNEMRAKSLPEDDPNRTALAETGLAFAEKAGEYAGATLPEVATAKGSMLCMLNKHTAALGCFREAFRLRPDFNSYKDVVMCMLEQDRVEDAYRLSQQAEQKLPGSARATVLTCVVLMRFSDGQKRARAGLSRALLQDPDCIEAVFTRSELDIEEGKFSEGVELLEKRPNISRRDKLHIRLGECYVAWARSITGTTDDLVQERHRKITEANKHFQLALGYAPTSVQAKEGLNEVQEELNAAGAGGAGNSTDAGESAQGGEADANLDDSYSSLDSND